MRLEVTRQSDLSVRALLALDVADRRVKGAAVADEIGTTAAFLPQVMTPLVRAGWVRSDPGPTGGYTLAVALADISVLDVVEAVEGPTDTGRCVLVDRPCSDAGRCALHRPWSSARDGLLRELARTPLSDVRADAHSVSGDHG